MINITLLEKISLKIFLLQISNQNSCKYICHFQLVESVNFHLSQIKTFVELLSCYLSIIESLLAGDYLIRRRI